MKQTLAYAGVWVSKSRALSDLDRPVRLPIAVGGVALLLLIVLSIWHGATAPILDSLMGEPKPAAIIALGIAANGLAGVALRKNRKAPSGK